MMQRIRERYEREIKVVTRMHLKLNQVDFPNSSQLRYHTNLPTIEFEGSFVCCNQMFIKEWPVDLTALTGADLRYTFREFDGIEPTIFNNMINLEVLILSGNKIKELDSNIFSCNKNLRKLKLDYNNLIVLSPGIFKGLDKLTELDLSDNQINVITESLFQDLVSLKKLDLRKNQLKDAEKIFKVLIVSRCHCFLNFEFK